MAFSSIRSITGGSESNGTAPTYTLPASVSSGDGLLVIAGTDGTATHTVPSGFTEKSQQDATQFQVQVFGKVADGTEGGTDVDGSLSSSESMCYLAMAIQDWSGDLNDIEVNTIVTGSGTSADPGSITASWGSDDNLFIAVAIGDYYDKIATVFPTGYSDNQTTQQHSDTFGGTQAVSLATKESASASDDPSAFTLVNTTGNAYAVLTIVVKPSSASQTLSSPTDPIEFDSTGNTVTANGFSGNLTTLTDQDTSYSYSITSQSGGDPNTVTFSAFPLIAMTEASGGIVGPTIGSVTLLGTYTTPDPDETATVATNTSLPTGYSSVTLSGSSNNAGTVGYGLNEVHSVTTADGDLVAYPTASNTVVNADGTLQTDDPDLYFYVRKDSTDTWYAVNFYVVTGETYYDRLTNLGYTGSLSDKQAEYLRDQGYNGSAGDMARDLLTDEGYDGNTLAEKLKQKADAEGYDSIEELMKKKGFIV